MMGETSSTDFSNRAYFWEGSVFLDNPNQYKSNFFNRYGHTTHKGFQTGVITFDHTARIGATTFMRYNDENHPDGEWP